MRKAHKIFTYCLIGSLTYFGSTAVVKAEEVPVAGIDLVLSSFYQNNDDAYKEITEYLTDGMKSEYKDISFAQVTNYVNIRSKASEESEILGKLYNNSAATILDKKDDWYRVKSGSVTGYIKSDFLITGEKAQQLAGEVGTKIATVNTTTLKVRKEASTDSQILTLIPIGDEFVVKKDQGDWVKILLSNNETGFVSSDYVDLHTEYEEAVSIEEERERLEEEAAAAREEQERNAANSRVQSAQSGGSSYNSGSNSSRSTSSSNSSSTQKSQPSQSSSNSSSIRNKIVNYALRFEGNPYVWGGTSLTNGADCSGFTQSVFRDNGIYIPRTSRTQAASGRRISLDQMQPGDLIFYSRNGSINHVGIYIGGGKVISASSPDTGIRITAYNYRTPVKVVSYIN